MSYQERRVLINLMSSILVSLAYAAYMVQRFPDATPYAPEVFHFWGAFFLILIPVAIVARIITVIIFTIINAVITQQVESDLTDERDRVIESRATQNGGYVFIVGFLLSMGSLVLSLPPSVMFIILFCSGLVSQIISESLQIRYYRRGF